MKKSEAAMLVAKIFAAYPAAKATDLTAELWMADLEPLRHDVAEAAVTAIRHECRFFPTVAEFLDVYEREKSAARFQLPALPPPPLTDAERADNLRRLRELTSRYTTERSIT